MERWIPVEAKVVMMIEILHERKETRTSGMVGELVHEVGEGKVVIWPSFWSKQGHKLSSGASAD